MTQVNSYIPITPKDREEMLHLIGVQNIEELLSDIPKEVRLKCKLNLPVGMSEIEINNYFDELSNKNNTNLLCFLGAGAYEHYIPSVVSHVLGRSEFYTAYTPYQPELSQGMLQAIFEYQTMICELTGMDVSNASVYDGATATSEAVFMAANITGKSKIAVSLSVNPEVRKVLKTYCRTAGIQIIDVEIKDGITDIDSLRSRLGNDAAGIVIQSPNFICCIMGLLNTEITNFF